MNDIHPDQVLETLKKTAIRKNKVHNLEAVHATCAALFKLGSADYSYATVGRMSEQRGGPAQNTLYTRTSTDYRILIKAWANWAKATSKRGPTGPKFATDDDLLGKIQDPAVRALLAMVVAERNRYREQVNTLKANANSIVDLRPLPGVVHVDPKSSTVVTMISPFELLTPSEIDALTQAISPAFFKTQDWSEDEDGAVKNQAGRKLFKPGFGSAIRKILDRARRETQ